MQRLEDLKPSPTGPIPLDVLRELPQDVIVLARAKGSPFEWSLMKLHEWGSLAEVAAWHYGVAEVGEWEPCTLPNVRLFDWRYPKLPRVSFSMTTEAISAPGDQPSGRCKSVTRRKPRLRCPGRGCREYLRPFPVAGALRCPEHGPHAEANGVPVPPQWAKVGNLFLAIDKLRRSRKQPPSRGLGVFQVASVELQKRWQCPQGDGPDHRRSWHLGCRMDGAIPQPHFRECYCGFRGAAAEFDTITAEELALEGFPGMDPDDFWAMLNGDTTCRIAFEAV